MHTNTFCKYRKKLLASPRVHLVVIVVVNVLLYLAITLPHLVSNQSIDASKRRSNQTKLKTKLDNSHTPLPADSNISAR